tara:strand:- start:1498 stop:2505 length:1008 start_codon:yes stop_codon:yes gene_type:complete
MKLYKSDKVWEIFANENNDIVRVYGKDGGKLITNITKVYPKNIGKSNETTKEQQANKEINALIKKQKELGYSSGGNGLFLLKPMLAQNYEKHSKKIKFPCHVQPKLDGIRLIAIIDTNVTFYSRTSKIVTGFDSLRNDLLKINKNIILDGEMYLHDTPFEEICSLFKNSSDKLEYHVFDIIDSSKTFTERYTLLKSLKLQNVVFTNVCENMNEIETTHSKFIENGYEGIMIRNSESVYEKDKRSYNLQKLKLFNDEEFRIVDIIEAIQDEDTAIFVCESNDVLFNVRPRGNKEYRQGILENRNDFLNKMLTVRYQNKTEKGIPRFPVGICIRDYE